MKKQQSNGMIEKGVPIPPHRGHGQPKYPWHEMDVGDSFLVSPDRVPSSNRVTWANLKYAPKHWIQRRTPEGMRVWRDK